MSYSGNISMEREPAGQPYLFGGKERLRDNGLNEYELPQLFAQQRNAARSRFYLAVAHQNGPTPAKSFDELAVARYSARRLCSALALWTAPDPLAQQYGPTNPYVYCAANPIAFIDPTGQANIYFQGECLGCDGIDDNRVLIIPDIKGTTYSDDFSEIKNNCGYSEDITNLLVEFVKSNNGSREAFQDNEDIYNMLIELPGNEAAMRAASEEMPESFKNKVEDNFREHGGFFENDQFCRVPPGEIANENSSGTSISFPNKDVPTIHSHPGGVLKNNKAFGQLPSPQDFKTAGTKIHYVIAYKQKSAVYIYNKKRNNCKI